MTAAGKITGPDCYQLQKVMRMLLRAALCRLRRGRAENPVRAFSGQYRAFTLARPLRDQEITLFAVLARSHSLRRADPDEKLTLIVWTTETIMAMLDDDAVTEDMAGEILPQIGDLDGVHECGVGLETLQVMHENILREQEQKRMVERSAGLLPSLPGF